VPDGLAGATVEAAAAEGLDPPRLLGAVHEATVGASARRRGGVFYTPAGVAERLVELALAGLVPAAGVPDAPLPLVADVAMGSGSFLLAAAQQLRRATGASGAACVGAMRGCDLDPDAVAVARTALAWWSWTIDGLPCRPAPDALCPGDGLARPGSGGPPSGAVDVVVGNPPFLNQLQGGTARSAEQRDGLRARFGTAATGYVDTALLFVLAGIDLVRDGGRVVLVQPESSLVASHGEAARQAIEQLAVLEGLWVGGAGIFDAGVRVCAPVLRRGDGPGEAGAVPGGGPVRLWVGPSVEPSGRIGVDSVQSAESAESAVMRDSAASRRFDVDSLRRSSPEPTAGRWAPLLAASRGVPSPALRAGGTLADLATATAGFRDQFYGLIPFVVDLSEPAAGCEPDGRFAPLITSGLVGHGSARWGSRPARFAGRRWLRPAVDLEALAAGNPTLARWVSARLRPKLLVATQTAVITASVDPAGRLVPSVPVVAVEPAATGPGPQPAEPGPGPDDVLWWVAAVLAAPVVSAVAATRHAGAGLSASALRLTARQILALPTPVDRLAWREAAEALRATATEPVPAATTVVISAMAAAYGVDAAMGEACRSWWMASFRHGSATNS